MRSYMPVFFGGGDLPPDVFARWQTWSRQYEKLWIGVVSSNMHAAPRGFEVDLLVVSLWTTTTPEDFHQSYKKKSGRRRSTPF